MNTRNPSKRNFFQVYKIYDISDLADDDGIATRGETEGKKGMGTDLRPFWVYFGHC
jgi:hypothetical protein